jgi:hypothetical protein
VFALPAALCDALARSADLEPVAGPAGGNGGAESRRVAAERCAGDPAGARSAGREPCGGPDHVVLVVGLSGSYSERRVSADLDGSCCHHVATRPSASVKRPLLDRPARTASPLDEEVVARPDYQQSVSASWIVRPQTPRLSRSAKNAAKRCPESERRRPAAIAVSAPRTPSAPLSTKSVTVQARRESYAAPVAIRRRTHPAMATAKEKPGDAREVTVAAIPSRRRGSNRAETHVAFRLAKRRGPMPPRTPTAAQNP